MEAMIWSALVKKGTPWSTANPDKVKMLPLLQGRNLKGARLRAPKGFNDPVITHHEQTH